MLGSGFGAALFDMDGDLDLDRAGVALVLGVLGDDGGFFRFADRHVLVLP